MNKKVLLVEDDPAIIEIYTTAFNNEGVEAEVISQGKEVLKRIASFQESPEDKPALILLDLILPDMNGLEILKEAKTNNSSKNIPVFILSNNTDVDFSAIGGIKPDKFIVKANITPTELAALVKKEI